MIKLEMVQDLTKFFTMFPFVFTHHAHSMFDSWSLFDIVHTGDMSQFLGPSACHKLFHNRPDVTAMFEHQVDIAATVSEAHHEQVIHLLRPSRK